MSRLAKKPLKLLPGITVSHGPDFISLKGPKGERKVGLPKDFSLRVEGENLWLEKNTETRRGASWGTTWALIRNAMQGVANGFSKTLEVEGVGYRAAVEGKSLVLFLGYAQPIRFDIPEGVTVVVEKNSIKISGIDKDLVGRVAADIRGYKKPEPYKGKGIRYQGETIRRKVGKKAAAAASG